MIQKIKTLILSLSSLFLVAMPLALASPAMAVTCSAGTSGSSDCIQGGLCQGAQGLSVTPGVKQCTEQDAGLQGTVATVINVMSVIIGVVAVIMIIVGGFRYVTSGGNAEQTKAARNTIVYALIGLVIVALAQVIVRFVLTRATNT